MEDDVIQALIINSNYAMENMSGAYKKLITPGHIDRPIINHNKESELSRSIIEKLTEGVIISDADGILLYFNKVAEEILGLGLTKVKSDEWSDFYGCFFPDAKTKYPSEHLPLARALKGAQVDEKLLFIKNEALSSGKYIELSSFPIYSAHYSIIGVSVIFKDVTEQVRFKKKIRQNTKRIKSKFRDLPIPTFIWKQDGEDFILVDYNKAAEELTNNQIKKTIGAYFSDTYADDPELIIDFLRCFHRKKSVNRELYCYMESINELKHFDLAFVYMEPDMAMVHAKDITVRKSSENEARKFSQAIEQTADSVLLTDQFGVIQYVNPAFEETAGYKKHEVIGKTPRILKSGKHGRDFYKNIWNTLLEGRSYQGTIINKKKSGELYTSQQTITPIKDDGGSICNFVSVLKDITELKKKQQLEIQLSLAQQLQQRLYHEDFYIPGIDIAGTAFPADETCGDYYDCINQEDGVYSIIIGDVCGHGVGPAIITAETRAYTRSFAQTESDPATLLNLINKELGAGLFDDFFVTLCIARINLKLNILDYAGAGHYPACLPDGEGNVKCILESRGIPLGVNNDFSFAGSEIIKINPNDLMLFITDGLVEASGPNEERFGIGRVLEILRNEKDRPASPIVQELYYGLCNFAGNSPQEGDITAIVGKVMDN